MSGSISMSALFELMGIHTSALDMTTPQDPVRRIYQWDFTSGHGNDQLNLKYHDQRTLLGNTSELLDLNGVLLDAFGQTLNFRRIKVFGFKASADNTDPIAVGGAASNAWTGPFGATNDIMVYEPDGGFLLVNPNNGWPVIPATADILQIANNSGTGGSPVTYDIWLMGCDA